MKICEIKMDRSMIGISALLLISIFCGHVSADLIASADEFSSMCCDFDGHYRVNLIPHPTNCQIFNICEPKQHPDGRISLSPTARECPLDESGSSQYFDFDSCRCVRGHEVNCYDHDLLEHYFGFFKCSDKVYDNGSTLSC